MEQQDETFTFLKEKSTWEPKDSHHTIKTYIESTQKHLVDKKKLNKRYLPRNNLT